LPLVTNIGFEQFNDCLYYRKVAKELMAKDERANIFEIRRALRSSFVSLWTYIDSQITLALFSTISKHLSTVKKEGNLSGEELSKFRNLLKMSFESKLGILELLTGSDLHSQKVVNDSLRRLQEIRNDIVHSGHFGANFGRGNSRMFSNQEFLEIVALGIATARAFTAILAADGLAPNYDFLINEEPVDLTKHGLGFFGFEGPITIPPGGRLERRAEEENQSSSHVQSLNSEESKA
jgi:hypothetical protein